MERRKLFNDPAFEKVEIARFLVNNLKLNELQAIKNLVKSGKLKFFMKNEQLPKGE